MRNRFRTWLAHLAVVPACLLLGACLDGTEEYHIARDGSGRASATYLVPTAAVLAEGGSGEMRRRIEDWIAGDERLRIDALGLTEQGDRTRIHLELAFESALALLDLTSEEELAQLPRAARALAGTVDFRLRGRSVEMVRTVRPRDALGGSLLLMPRQELERHRLTYRIALPAVPEEHNATSTADDGRTLVWNYTLGEATRSPPVMRYAIKLPLPWWLWAAAAVLLLGITGAIAALVRRRRRKRPATRARQA